MLGAEEAVRSALEAADHVHAVSAERGKSSRLIGEMEVDGRNLSDLLLENELAATPGRPPWVGPKPRILPKG